MTVGVLGHPVERRYQLTPPPSRFYLVHFSGELLLDALANADMVRTESHIPQKVDALARREHALVPLHQETGTLHAPVDGITNLPQFRFRFTQYDAVITIAVEMTHGIPVLQIMVQIHRQKQIAQPLRAAQADTQTFRHQADKALQHGHELCVLEHPADAIHHKILLHALVEFGDVKLVTVTRTIRVLGHVTADIRQEVVHTPSLDTGGGGTDETFPQMAVHHRHDGMHGDAVLHRDHLDAAQLAALDDLAFTVVLHAESTGCDLRGQLLQHLGLMREQIAPLAAAFTLAAAKDLPEGSLHVGRLHDLLDNIPNPAHKLLFIAFNTGPSIPRARLLRTVSGLPNPTRHFIFQFSGPYGPLLLRLAPLGTTVGTSPRCCTPIKISFRLLFRREPMFVFVFEESLFAFDIETPPFGFALLLPR